jgi:formylglycine-generating enzyme required for sulfatase activity
MEEVYRHLGKTTKILRENTSAFVSQDWTPLLPTLKDSIWVNEFPAGSKKIYTVFSLVPEGYKGPLFEAETLENTHFIDIWRHEEIQPDTINGKLYLPVTVSAFDKHYLGTRREGNIDCIARLPKVLAVKLKGDSLRLGAHKGDKIVVWAGNPAYDGKFYELPVKAQTLSLRNLFGRYEGKFVIQLFEKEELFDERVVNIHPGTARLISGIERTARAQTAPEGMVAVPAGVVKTKLSSNDSFIRYPDFSGTEILKIKKFYIDQYPVTNAEYNTFISATNYKPTDDYNYLRHWENGKIPPGMENYPVVWVGLEDAKAYARWAGKRLPTEFEWQLAAQGTDGRLWPWGNEMDSTRCNVGLNRTTPVNAFPDGASPFGVEDLVGNVWQLTNDVYDNGSYYFVMMRGGSFYNPTSSWWYVKGGPQALDKHQMLLLVSPGFDRCATVGFRCVKDAQ